MDESFNSENDSKVKLLYIESISNPQKLLKHASFLIRKGSRIAAAIKAGSSEEQEAARHLLIPGHWQAMIWLWMFYSRKPELSSVMADKN